MRLLLALSMCVACLPLCGMFFGKNEVAQIFYGYSPEIQFEDKVWARKARVPEGSTNPEQDQIVSLYEKVYFNQTIIEISAHDHFSMPTITKRYMRAITPEGKKIFFGGVCLAIASASALCYVLCQPNSTNE